MKKNSDKDIGLMSASGICIDGDILMRCEQGHTTKSYLMLRIMLAFIATLCTAVMGNSFIDGNTLSTVLLFHSIAATTAVCLFKSKYAIIKVSAAIISFIYIATIALMFDEVKYGFYIAVYDYMKKAGISPGSWGTHLIGIDCSDQQYLFYFFMAVILIIAIGTSIACVYRIDFPLLFIFTFPVFELGMYQGFEAPTISVAGLLVCWVTVLSMHIINHTTNKAGRKNTFAVHERTKSFFFTSHDTKAAFYPVFMGFVSMLTAVVFTAIVLFSLLTGFVRPQSFDALRTNLHHALTDFDISNLDELMSQWDGGANLYGVTTVGGTNGGILGTSNGISFNGVTALKITTDKFDYTMYLRGYVAGKYENNTWTAYSEDKESDEFNDYFDDADFWPQDYNYLILADIYGDNTQTMDITVKGACKKFVYAPYAALYTSSENIKADEMTPFNESYVKTKKNNVEYSFYYYNLSKVSGIDWADKAESISNSSSEAVSQTYLDSKVYKAGQSYRDYVYQTYLDAADIDSLKAVYNEIVDTYFDGNLENINYDDVYRAIRNYFTENNYTYELNPGATPKGEDFIDYFLTEQKEGYCTYFATVGTQLLRMFGYPSRYVEGYMVLSSQLGSQADANGRYEVTVPDKCAHAWAEVFIDGCGWMPAEFTPGYDNDNPNLTEKEKDPDSDITTTTTTTAASSLSSSEIDNSSSQAQTTKSAASAQSDSSGNDSGAGNGSNSSDSGQGTAVSSGEGNMSGGDKAGTTLKVSTAKTDKDESFEIPAFVKSLLIMIAGIALIVIMLAYNRQRRLKIMNKRCSLADLNARVLEIFRYSLKYLAMIDISTNKNLSDLQICQALLEKCHEKNINELDDKLTALCEIAVKAHMSDRAITEAEAETAEKTMRFIADKVVEPSLSKFDRISARYIHGLY